MPTVPTQTPPRERRLQNLVRSLGLLGVGLTLVAGLASHFGTLGTGAGFSFMRGLGLGMLLTLPIFFGMLALRALRVMDEYARYQHLVAASIAFLVVMLLSGVLLALQPALNLQTPAWVYYLVGMLTWGVAVQVQQRRSPGQA